MPIAISFTLLFAFILPAFILYEPPESGETVSLKLMAVICLAVFGISTALFRVFGSWWRTRRLIADWSLNAVPIELGSVTMPVFKLCHPFPVFAAVGLSRPRLYIAEQVLRGLEPSEIRAVIRHEMGHITAMDNLKRLAMKICGDILVFPFGRVLDQHWSETAERAADDYAVEHGSRSTPINLASALIKIARLVPEKTLPPMPDVSYAVQADDSLEVRVRRLLNLAEREGVAVKPTRGLLPPIGVLAIVGILILATDARLLETIHDISETILALLQ